MHASKRRKQAAAESGAAARPAWDREKAMAVDKMDRKRTEEIVRGASTFQSRFAHGSGKMFS